MRGVGPNTPPPHPQPPNKILSKLDSINLFLCDRCRSLQPCQTPHAPPGRASVLVPCYRAHHHPSHLLGAFRVRYAFFFAFTPKLRESKKEALNALRAGAGGLLRFFFRLSRVAFPCALGYTIVIVV